MKTKLTKDQIKRAAYAAVLAGVGTGRLKTPNLVLESLVKTALQVFSDSSEQDDLESQHEDMEAMFEEMVDKIVRRSLRNLCAKPD